MNGSFQALLAGAIDYAGLFPPAELPLEPALTNYLRYRQDPDAWMLGSFVVPVTRLQDMGNYAVSMRQQAAPIPFTILARGNPTIQGFLDCFEADLQLLAAFREQFGSVAEVRSLEIRLPEEVQAAAGVSAGLQPWLRELSGRLRDHGLTDRTVFVEVASTANGQEATAGLIQGLASCSDFLETGYKLRCGGLVSAAFPSSERVAFTLEQCRAAMVRLKLTAGLHHPLPRFEPALGVTMHGFVNVFAAAAIAYCWAPPREALVQILNEPEPHAFTFDEIHLRWKDWRVDLSAIGEARRKLLLSFGSCSFDEPREDLRAVGWL